MLSQQDIKRLKRTFKGTNQSWKIVIVMFTKDKVEKYNAFLKQIHEMHTGDRDTKDHYIDAFLTDILLEYIPFILDVIEQSLKILNKQLNYRTVKKLKELHTLLYNPQNVYGRS